MNRRKILAFYLPQYYPFKENNDWWGEGFTEWTSVGRAKPLFKGHYQPKVPADLSYYDLRLPIVREQQASLAKQYGVDGFCYWHYWFGNGRRLLDLVEKEVVESGRPDFPFCFCWANHTWYAKNWNSKDSNRKHKILIEQTYPGTEDFIAHFNCCLNAFCDNRYIKVNNKPVFCIYDAEAIPDFNLMRKIWNELAVQNGFDGIYWMSYSMTVQKYERVKHLLFDEFIVDPMNLAEKKQNKIDIYYRKALSYLGLDSLQTLRIVDYSKYADCAACYFSQNENVTICILPNYDHSPRSGRNALILKDSTPEKFGILCKKMYEILEKRNKANEFVFLKSWNEWGEGNYLEPDLRFGKGFLEQLKRNLTHV